MEVIQQCPNCNSQGEIMNTERIILELQLVRQLNVVIKKLNDEVDRLNKQKSELEDKLKQTKGVKDD